MRWNDFEGVNSGFFFDRVKEITGYTRDLFYGTTEFLFVGSTPLSEEQLSLLNLYLKLK